MGKGLDNTRGETTRQALIDAGLKLFGEYGFSATSTRMLTDLSGTNIAAISYHFGSKEALYHAVITYIAEQIRHKLGDRFTHIKAALSQPNLTNTEAKKQLISLIMALSSLFVESDAPKHWAFVIMREQINPSPAFSIIYNHVMQPVHETLATLIAHLTGHNPKDDVTIIKAHMLVGQVLIFLSARETILRRLHTKKFTAIHLTTIQEQLRKHVLACVGIKEDA